MCLFVHIRQQHTVGMEDLHEILANAATTGASVHICHTLATGRYAGQSGWADMLQMVTGINAHGVDVSMEQYPYPYVRAQGRAQTLLQELQRFWLQTDKLRCVICRA